MSATTLQRFATLLLLALCPMLQAQVIPANHRVDWDNVGYPGNLPNPQCNTVDVTHFGATGDGTTNDHAAFVAAINALGGQPGIVYIPAGDYRIMSGISVPSGTIIRGENATDSRLLFELSSSGYNCFSVHGSAAGGFVDVTAGLQKTSTVLTLADASSFAVGGYAELQQDNGSWDTNPASWADNSVGQIVKIEAVNGNDITIADPLRIDYELALNPQIRPLNPKTDVGFECFYMERVNDPETGASYNISMVRAANCWVKGIHSNKSIGAHVYLSASTNLEVTGNYIHHSFIYDGSGTRGYGVTINHHAGQCLVADNVFEHLRHAMMTKQGANGNVFAYNYSFDGYRSEVPNKFAADISLHGHYSFGNLFEGNISELLWIDDYWGPTGPYNTFMRNRLTTYGIYMTSSGSNDQNFVGNEITSSAAFQGKYTIVGSGHVEYGNNQRGTIIPSGTSPLNDDSYYLASAPDFWDIPDFWPSIGIPNPIDTGTNPAKSRFDNGGLTVCYGRDLQVAVKAKVYSEALYDSSTQSMDNALLAYGLLPLQQPFNRSPWNYAGGEAVDSLPQFPPETMDWVLLEIRGANGALVAQKAALLLSDGTLTCHQRPDAGAVYLDGIAYGGNYKLSVKTRNHLAVLAANPVALPNAVPYDFTVSGNVEGGAASLALLGAGLYGMAAGDFDSNGSITTADFNLLRAAAAQINVYTDADADMNRTVTVDDLNWMKKNTGAVAPALVGY